MSRAFVKENDDAPEAPQPDIPVGSAPNLVTERGAGLILERIAGLRRALEGLAEQEAEPLRRELRYWEARRASMRLLRQDPGAGAVGFGTEVVVRRPEGLQTLRIVGEDEADPLRGLLAWTSPLARALDEAEPGEIVDFEAGGRTTPLEILSVRPL
ncbi:GreA/GreB family elongation factor [Neomegalonema sp.]|uniref:GreA/GreB family elongation factor n=1 Tax=Neomegalonema sp. TaxID=2039713 RepID=UPI00261F0EB5|nr:GreA/GreB family elongation factor [Neomegalonema sp.]MDD2867769.1 GreA/GreB family elongation factor [Neomegalonema sp.]